MFLTYGDDKVTMFLGYGAYEVGTSTARYAFMVLGFSGFRLRSGFFQESTFRLSALKGCEVRSPGV